MGVKNQEFLPIALVLAVLAFFARRRPGSSDESEQRHDDLQDRNNSDADRDQEAIEDERDRDVQEIKDEVEQEIDDLRTGGDDGFMDRANAHDRTGSNYL